MIVLPSSIEKPTAPAVKLFKSFSSAISDRCAAPNSSVPSIIIVHRIAVSFEAGNSFPQRTLTLRGAPANLTVPFQLTLHPKARSQMKPKKGDNYPLSLTLKPKSTANGDTKPRDPVTIRYVSQLFEAMATVASSALTCITSPRSRTRLVARPLPRRAGAVRAPPHRTDWRCPGRSRLD